MTIKIYGLAGTHCTERVMATIFEKGITDFELVNIKDLRDIKKPEFLAIQPFGQIPVYQDGPLTIFDFTSERRVTLAPEETWSAASRKLLCSIVTRYRHLLTWLLQYLDESSWRKTQLTNESRSIARVIEHKYESQGTPLYGKTLEDKALVENWLEVEGQNFLPVMFPIVVQLILKPWSGGQTDHAIVDAGIVKLEKVLDVYEERLSKSKYLAGDFFSLADLSHLPYAQYLPKILAKKGDLIEKRPHVKVWWDDISSRPAWKKVEELGTAFRTKHYGCKH